MSKRIAIITGATGGIGREFTRLLVEEDIDEVWTVARNEKKLQELKKLYGEKVIPLAKDLTHTEEICEIEEKIKGESAEVLYLVNNAGMAKMGSYQEFSIQELENTIDLNCKAPVILSNLCIPYMKKGSHILNISSASAFQPNPYINLYAASKAFERSYSRALNVEVENLGIIVTAVCPSWVDTEMLIKERNGKKVKFPGIVTAEAVAKQAMKDAKKGKDMSICKCQINAAKAYDETLDAWIEEVFMKKTPFYTIT